MSNILFQIFVLSRRLKNCLPSNSDDSSVSSILGKKYDDILPRISAVLEQNRRNATRPKVELNLSNSENYIYLLEDTKMNFLKILQKDIFELNMLDTKEVFENIWEKILFLWAKSISFRGEDANETEEIFEHLLDYEIILFNYKFAPPMMDCESIEDLYIHTKRECYKLLSKVL